ncbi:hypothetical protein XENOCAPTIV_003902, partial [Xenoophorus captivus]
KRKKELAPKVLEFPCPVCGKVYPMQKRLTQHMKTHSSEKPHMCDKVWRNCFYSSANSAFTLQSSVYKENFLYMFCLFLQCGKSFKKRFKCEFCDYSCENKKLLLNHQLSHTNDRPFKCDYCKYSTSKEEFLVSHMAIKHTGEKPFSCDMCHFTTKHRKNLRLHVQCRHPEAFDEWSLAHPEEPVRRQRKPFFTLQEIEELKQQHDDNPTLQNTIVAVLKSQGSEAEGGAVSALTVAPNQGQKIMTFHVSENGEAVLQEAYEAASSDTGELTHIAIETYEDGEEFSVVEEPAGEIHSPEYSSEAPASPTAISSPNTKRFCCRICMESFNGRSDMENHKRAHMDPNSFKCPDCDFTSTSWPEVKAHQTAITPERLQALGQDHIIVSQEPTPSDQVQYIISQDGVEHIIPQEYVVVADGNHIQIAVSHDGQIQYVPVSSEAQMVNAEDLEAAAHSAVTG